ncbi:MAG TPA: hypothetical protein VHB97_09645 [Polyangia bacterium]|nr:hypothetical protein [Polyangia bacterium]
MRELSIVGACLVAVTAVAGCGGGGVGASCPTGASMDAVQTQIFDGCTVRGIGGCHSVAPFAANLDLTRGKAWGHLVHAPSNSSPGKWRVEPGDVDSSFLWHKLTDSLASDKSEGAPMPRDANDNWAPLADAQLAAVRCWIASGAPAQ